jgi:enoyl-CoA hydratase
MELMREAMKLAQQISKQAPIAVRACKTAINEGIHKEMNEAVEIEERMFGSCFETADQVEGMTAFLEKRKVEKFLNR